MYYLYTKKLYNMLLTHHKGFIIHIYYKIIINYHYYTTSDYILSDLYFMSFSVCQHQCPVETLILTIVSAGLQMLLKVFIHHNLTLTWLQLKPFVYIKMNCQIVLKIYVLYYNI